MTATAAAAADRAFRLVIILSFLSCPQIDSGMHCGHIGTAVYMRLAPDISALCVIV
jgi:hypothetical protein